MNELLKKGKVLKKEQWIVIVVCGVLLLLLAIPFETGTKQSEDIVAPIIDLSTGSQSDEFEYTKELEDKLETMLEKMESVGAVSVFITLATSAEQVVEKDVETIRDTTLEEDASGGSRENTQVEIKSDTVYNTTSGDESPYIIKSIQPQIEGVMVVAQGANSGTVNKNITEAIQALFNIEAHKIKVVKMKEGN